MMLQPLSTDLYLVSMPGLTQRFAASMATVQLTLSAFALGFATMQLLSGPLSDRFGRRPVVLGGIALYLLASLACATAPSIEALIVARFVQAIGCCSVVVAARAIIRDVYGPVGSARALAQALSVLAAGPIAGPILGAALEVRFGHQAAFLALAVFAGILLVITLGRLPETNLHRSPTATRPGRFVANYVHVLKSREFTAFAILGIASHGINFPCAMAGTVAPFPRHAGAAAGMFGFLSMGAAAFVGTAIGLTPEGTTVPLAAAVAGASVASLATVAFLLRPLLANRHRMVSAVANTGEID